MTDELVIHRQKPMLPRSDASKLYYEAASALEVGDAVLTVNKNATVGVLRALERMNRTGTQRKDENGNIWVWRRT